jgi:AmiR/NasT family two-component response regulator
MPRRAFDDDSFLYSEILAQHTSVAIAGDNAAEEFHRALANRDVIGQAKGIIMERFGIDAGQAFAMLTKLSQDSNTKLSDLAKRVVDTRDQS